MLPVGAAEAECTCAVSLGAACCTVHRCCLCSQPRSSSSLDTLSEWSRYVYAPLLKHRSPPHLQVDWPALYASAALARANERRCEELLQQGSSQQAALQVTGEYAQSLITQVRQLPLAALCCATTRRYCCGLCLACAWPCTGGPGPSYLGM
jgi:hypothetical protein